MTTVVNLRREPYDVYIGRAGKGQDGYFGNPYRVQDYRRRTDCLEDYARYLRNRVLTDPEFRARLESLRGKRLGCFCKPGPCHGDVIVEWLEGTGGKRG